VNAAHACLGYSLHDVTPSTRLVVGAFHGRFGYERLHQHGIQVSVCDSLM